MNIEYTERDKDILNDIIDTWLSDGEGWLRGDISYADVLELFDKLELDKTALITMVNNAETGKWNHK